MLIRDAIDRMISFYYDHFAETEINTNIIQRTIENLFEEHLIRYANISVTTTDEIIEFIEYTIEPEILLDRDISITEEQIIELCNETITYNIRTISDIYTINPNNNNYYNNITIDSNDYNNMVISSNEIRIDSNTKIIAGDIEIPVEKLVQSYLDFIKLKEEHEKLKNIVQQLLDLKNDNIASKILKYRNII